MPVPVAGFAVRFIVDSDMAVLSNSQEIVNTELESVNQQIGGAATPVVAVVPTKEETDSLARRLEALENQIPGITAEVQLIVERKIRELIPLLKAEFNRGRSERQPSGRPPGRPRR
jgi:hypothetical protein